jgi:hypothetical protein
MKLETWEILKQYSDMYGKFEAIEDEFHFETDSDDYSSVVISFYENSAKCHLYYVRDHMYNRNPQEGPASIWWYDTGELLSVEYLCNSIYSNGNKPSLVRYHRNGKVSAEQYWLNGHIHRPISEGPAIISYGENGNVIAESFMENGVYV